MALPVLLQIPSSITAAASPPPSIIRSNQAACRPVGLSACRPVGLSACRVLSPSKLSSRRNSAGARQPRKLTVSASASGDGDGSETAVTQATGSTEAEASKPKTKLAKGDPDTPPGPLIQAAWYASEAFGNLAALARGTASKSDSPSSSESLRKIPRDEALAKLREDYDKCYFVNGDMTMDIYTNDCEFADPFVSFRGKERFQRNVANLGSFMQDVNLQVTDWQVSENEVTSSWRFRCTLGLPWSPTLAASGGTTHVFDPESGRIAKHVERWDISPLDGLQQLVRPGRKPRPSS